VTQALVKRGGPALVSALNSQSYLQHPWQKVHYVHSTHSRSVDGNNTGQNPDAPLKTLVKANSLAAAGDMILVGPGHVENVLTAAGLDFSKNYLTVIGCGHDAERPVINVGGVIGAYWQISGTGVRMANFKMAPTLDAVTKMLNISGPGVLLDGFRIDEASTFESVVAILVAATASRGKIRKLTAEQYTAGATACIEIGGALTEFEISDSIIRGNYSTGNISVTAAALQLAIGRNLLSNLNTNVCIICGAVAASGEIYDNRCTLTGATAAPFAAAITLGSAIWRLYENYATDAAGLTGALIGTAAT
jgi:hypothetical protein